MTPVNQLNGHFFSVEFYVNDYQSACIEFELLCTIKNLNHLDTKHTLHSVEFEWPTKSNMNVFPFSIEVLGKGNDKSHQMH